MAPTTKGNLMTTQQSEAQYNCNNEKDRKATVSIRSMSVSVWHLARVEAIKKEYTLAQYITELIEKDISNKQ